MDWDLSRRQFLATATAAALAEGGRLRALEVDLPVERHEQLHSFQLRIVRGERSALIDKLEAEATSAPLFSIQ